MTQPASRDAGQATGQHLVALQEQDGGSHVWTSADGGGSWTDRVTMTLPGGGEDGCGGVASDATGTHLVAVGSSIWTSADSGKTWTRQNGPPPNQATWSSVASDSTGTHPIVAARCTGFSGDIWTSADAGSMWTNATAGTAASGQFWKSVATNATGDAFIAVDETGDIWTR